MKWDCILYWNCAANGLVKHSLSYSKLHCFFMSKSLQMPLEVSTLAGRPLFEIYYIFDLCVRHVQLCCVIIPGGFHYHNTSRRLTDMTWPAFGWVTNHRISKPVQAKSQNSFSLTLKNITFLDICLFLFHHIFCIWHWCIP